MDLFIFDPECAQVYPAESPSSGSYEATMPGTHVVLVSSYNGTVGDYDLTLALQ